MMVAFGKDKLISIRLSREEQLCILQYCQDLPPRIHRRIETATDGTLRLMEGDADILYASLCYTLQNINNEKVATLFDRLIDRIPFSDVINEEKRNAPDPRRGYLTPEQITRFQDYAWGDIEFPLQFDHDLLWFVWESPANFMQYCLNLEC